MISEADKNLWLVALRSGEYKKTNQVYADAAGNRCAIGVLADAVGQRDGVELSDAVNMYCLRWGRRALPLKVLAEIFEMNDNGSTFPQIADYVDQHVAVFHQSADSIDSAVAA